MASNSSPIVPLVAAAFVAVAVAVGISKLGNQAGVTTAVEGNPSTIKPRWTATAQGRVEPRTGEVKVSALSPGRIAEVVAALNDKVSADDLLARIDDADVMAKVMAADAEAGVRKRERDSEPAVGRQAQDRRVAEDKLNSSDRAVTAARMTLDRLLIARHKDQASVTPAQLSAARTALDEARRQVVADREAYRQTQIAAGVPLPTRLEAGLTQARADLSLAEDALDRTRIRAPFDGTVLQVFARTGELAAASPEQTLFIVGDLSQLRVRAEVEERDAAHVKVGQTVVLKTDAFAGREFGGKVASVAQAMRPPKLAQRGPRRPSDVDTLEVLVDVDAGSSLMPGMRVDVYFKAEGERQEAAQPRAEAPGQPASTGSTSPAPQRNEAVRAEATPVAPPAASGATSQEAPRPN
ncbi:MAG: efflux RND transporter periplasmic adaptor subunit [Proteobacteria bacterium]|nr:efflux RND transporter periplasmic adaptor subunit [Pseudomonadota bacterium]